MKKPADKVQIPIIQENKCASILKTLADDVRLKVIQILLEGAQHVNEINKKLKIDQSLLSHHLKTLRDSGIVISKRDGKAVLYSISPEVSIKHREKAVNLGCCKITF